MSTTTFTVNIPSEGLSASVQLKIVKKAKDIIMFVAGTTDPINVTGLKHEANKGYWRDKKHQDNLWATIKKLKPQYLDLHIEDEFFSWSGDNNHDARVEAAERLLDLFLRVYSGWLDKDVCLHLIGHSHGGNVINEFTNVIVSNKSFPKTWKIKSITYLSTPFFKKQHQLNHTHLHEDCKIINVHNEYDITQRFVADFTLKNLEHILSTFHSGKINEAIDKIKLVIASRVYAPITDTWSIMDDHAEGPLIWERTALIFECVNTILDEIIGCISNFDCNLDAPREKLLTLFTDVKKWATTTQKTFEKNSTSRKGGYNIFELIADINYITVFKSVNKILEIRTGLNDSYLLNILVEIFDKNTGLTYSIDNTSWSPTNQVNGKFEIEDMDITSSDIYHSRGKQSQFETFARGVESSLANGNLREVLMSLISQFIFPNNIKKAIGVLDILITVMTGDTGIQLRTLNNSLKQYYNLVKKYHAELISDLDKPKKEKNNEDLDYAYVFTESDKLAFKRKWLKIEDEYKKKKLRAETTEESNHEDPIPGTIPYLAVVSHSLSHTAFWKEVETGLRGAFVSGKNLGYKE